MSEESRRRVTPLAIAELTCSTCGKPCASDTDRVTLALPPGRTFPALYDRRFEELQPVKAICASCQAATMKEEG